MTVELHTNRSTVSILDGDHTDHTMREVTPWEKTSPLDFDEFLPWVCKEWECPVKINIKRIEEQNEQRPNLKSKIKPNQDALEPESRKTSKTMLSSGTICYENGVTVCIPVITFYDKDKLIEILIYRSELEVNHKLLCAIDLCLPFHPLLTKLSVSMGGLTSAAVHDIAKMLSHSNLTEICFDDNVLPEGNYFELLEHTSQLKVLSLSRCQINDEICKEIVARIDYNDRNTLAVLNLGCNDITDEGARFLGVMLRRNRSLIHLNLCSNKITDEGFRYLLTHLIEFPLTKDEIIGKRHKWLNYVQRRTEAFNNCVAQIKQREIEDASSHKSKQSILKKKKGTASVADIAKMTNEIIGEYNDCFDKNNVVNRDGYAYCTGNLKLCSLNVAYNNLDGYSLDRLIKVLRYQKHVYKPPRSVGLIRLILDGNRIPDWCEELDDIAELLKDAISKLSAPQLPSVSKRRHTIAK